MTKKNRELTPASNSPTADKDYQNLLQELRGIIAKGQYAAYKAVDNLKIQTYWQLGERIVREELSRADRAEYGKYLIDNLTADLGTERRELYRIVKFYRCYEIVATVSPQLSWSHYENLIELDDKKRPFYQNNAILHSWSVRELRKQIKSKLYEKTSPQEVAAVFRAELPTVEPAEVFKDAYNFNFIELEHHENERDLEKKIISNCPAFLKELGADFAFVGNQAPLKIDSETHFIDLVLYHRAIPCAILVDLKMGKLDSRDIGQMNKYVEYWRRHKQYKHEKDTIGLIICREAGREEVVYALGGLEEKIFVAEYKVKLPSETTIKKALREL